MSSDKTPSRKTIWEKIREYLSRPAQRIGVVLLVTGPAWVLLKVGLFHVPAVVDEVLLTFAVMSGIHLLYVSSLTRDAERQAAKLVQAAVREEFAVLSHVQTLGLDDVFANRDEAKPAIRKSIGQAKTRVWLMGIEFYDIIHDRPILDPLEEYADQLDVRLLALDALKSPAAFRTILESSKHEASDFLGDPRSYERGLIPRRCRDLIEETRERRLRNCLRFYGHTPLGWMVIVDDVMYYQPYSFGQPKKSLLSGKCIGDALPVLKLKDHGGGSDRSPQRQPSPFEVLEQHFDVLWQASDTDWFHMDLRLRSSTEHLVSQMLRRRENWFKHVVKTLQYMASGREQVRKEVRFALAASGTTPARLLSKGSSLEVELIDCSVNGAQVRLGSSDFITAGALVNIEPSDSHQYEPRQQAILQHLSSSPYSVLPSDEDRPEGCLGLRRQATT